MTQINLNHAFPTAQSARGIMLGMLAVGCTATGQVGHQPICAYTITLSQSQTISLSGCSSYTNCDADYDCAEGEDYKDCGLPDIVDSYCQEYVGGWFNTETNQCESGVPSGPAEIGPGIVGFPNPKNCGSGIH